MKTSTTIVLSYSYVYFYVIFLFKIYFARCTVVLYDTVRNNLVYTVPYSVLIGQASPYSYLIG